MNQPTDSASSPAGTGVKTVMIVDDSRVMRAWLRSVLAADPRLDVVEEACNAQDARDKLRARPVDVLTLDIEMPGMNGIEFLTRLMRARPMPVVMFSSHTAEGSDAAVQSLSLGAIDCIVKPSQAFGPDLMDDLRERVYQAACTRPSSPTQRAVAVPPVPASRRPAPVSSDMGPERPGALILIGASTGGVAALETLLPGLRPDGPPVVIVQHMPGNFLRSFVGRLDRVLHQNVVLAQSGLTLQRGDVVLAPGDGQHTQVRFRGGVWECHFAPNEPRSLHCPAVDVLFMSAVQDAKRVAAAILTGLGRDGAEGLSALRAGGARTFGQDAASCVVYGMPRAAMAAGAVEKQMPLDQIASGLNSAFQRGASKSISRAASSS